MYVCIWRERQRVRERLIRAKTNTRTKLFFYTTPMLNQNIQRPPHYLLQRYPLEYHVLNFTRQFTEKRRNKMKSNNKKKQYCVQF